MNIETKNKLKKCLTCTICNKLFYYPITLHCQDTFCQSCITKIKLNTNKSECPKCKKPTIIVPVHNYNLMDIIQKLFSEETKLRENEVNKNKTILKTEDQIKENIIKDNWREIINKHKPTNDNIIPLNHEFIVQLENLI